MGILNTIFTSGMVLQANKPIRIFGEGQGRVTVRLGTQSASTVADGAWLLELAPMGYGGPYEILVEHDGEETVLSDVWMGDVFLLAGQSNMALKLMDTNHPVERYEANDRVRLYAVDRPGPDKISSSDGWVALTRENAEEFPAIGYHVGVMLASENRRIGLISCSQGASIIQSWMPREVAAYEQYQVKERGISHTKYEFNAEGYLYEWMTSKILPYSLHTVLWYQGESNVSDSGEEARIYLSLLEGLIDAWRREFKDSALPFIVIQLADFDGRSGEPWTNIQNAQMQAQDVIPHVRTVVCRDVCERDDIHPATKHILAARIAALL